ncbi:hypothetical protein D3C85_1819090 [compost metagenome]
MSAPRTKLGAVVATVALRFVPNCSAEIVTKVAQYPTPKPIIKARLKNFVAVIPSLNKYHSELPMIIN